MEAISKDIYKMEVTLPNNPLKALNCYVVKSEGEVLVIDTGFNLKECEESFMQGLAELSVNISDVRLVATHLHSDHCGLCGKLEHKVKEMYMGAKDLAMITRWIEKPDMYRKGMQELMNKTDNAKHGLSTGDNPGYSLMFEGSPEFTPLYEGDVISAGKYNFTVIDTPGHTPGHICLYDKEHRLFISGDHILARITPNITFWGFEYGDMLGTYMESLKKVQNLDVDMVLTGHRHMPESLKTRVDELLQHHEMRLSEIIVVLEEENAEISVSDIAARLSWSIRAKDWYSFPKPQKWFSSLETMSHLEHLIAKDIVVRYEHSGIYTYALK